MSGGSTYAKAHIDLIRMIEQSVLARRRLSGASSDQFAGHGCLSDEAECCRSRARTSRTSALARLPAAAMASVPDKKKLKASTDLASKIVP